MVGWKETHVWGAEGRGLKYQISWPLNGMSSKWVPVSNQVVKDREIRGLALLFHMLCSRYGGFQSMVPDSWVSVLPPKLAVQGSGVLIRSPVQV